MYDVSHIKAAACSTNTTRIKDNTFNKQVSEKICNHSSNCNLLKFGYEDSNGFWNVPNGTYLLHR